MSAERGPARVAGSRWARRARRAAAVGPGLTVSTVLVSVFVGPALPAYGQLVLFFGGLAVVVVLWAGVGEPAAVAVLFPARAPAAVERTALAPALAELTGADLGPPLLSVLVARRPSLPTAAARGRRTVVVSAELVAAVVAGRISAGDAAVLIAHAACVADAGLRRHDPVIGFWSAPWRVLGAVLGPVIRVLGPLQYLWPVVAAVAICQNLFSPSPSMPSSAKYVIAAVLAGLLVLTYAVPWAARSWDRYETCAGDQLMAELGLGPALAAALTTVLDSQNPTAQTQTRVRIAGLEAKPEARPALSLVRPDAVVAPLRPHS